MEEPIYAERQNFHTGFYLLMLATGVGGMVMALPRPGGTIDPVLTLSGFFMLAVATICVNLLSMTTRVLSTQVAVHFGRTLYYYSKSIPIADIQRVEAVTYHPLRGTGGWGIRWGTYDGQRSRYFTAKGDRAVLIETPTTRYIIGTQDPERLAAAIQEAMEQAPLFSSPSLN